MPSPFENYQGIAAPLGQVNINTDAIIPATYMRSASANLGAGLFARWRYEENGEPKTDFILNQTPYDRASILIAGANFGCGSSREAAVWALLRFGIRCVIAPSYADIFYENCFRNGLLPALVSPADLEIALTQSKVPHGGDFFIDLKRSRIFLPQGEEIEFSIPPMRRDALLRGDDDIATTLRHEEALANFNLKDRQARPWIYAMENPT